MPTKPKGGSDTLGVPRRSPSSKPGGPRCQSSGSGSAVSSARRGARTPADEREKKQKPRGASVGAGAISGGRAAAGRTSLSLGFPRLVNGRQGPLPGMEADTTMRTCEKAMTSITVTQDPRFKEISGFWKITEQRAQSPANVQKLDGKKRMGEAGLRYAAAVTESDDTAQLSNEVQKQLMERKIGGRVAFEDSFRGAVRNLLVDFELSEDATCRLNHLDRLHGWFRQQGTKSTRSTKPSPSFLTFEPGAEIPPGMLRGHEFPLSESTMLLSGTMKMNISTPMRVAASASSPTGSRCARINANQAMNSPRMA
eukprot:NODE_10645_length_1338_cov_3.583815.p1 GENE.NODE_10645_length_1338_cov_3.583815~~NODE_10645_length_1338_cov_3.583815.p1  ORF type:complete len:311 (-),score=28.75 NODE_10645_length_1338_cov_3.583815:247-1179(-)